MQRITLLSNKLMYASGIFPNICVLYWVICMHLYIIALQQDYQFDSFIQYVGWLPTGCTCDRSLHAYYIAFQKMGDEWLRFDDGVVHKVQLTRAYSVNLVTYQLATAAAYVPPMNLDAVPQLGKSVILNRKNSKQSPSSPKGGDPQETPNSKSISGPPPLITPSSLTSDQGEPSTDPILKPEVPTRRQPS